MSAPLPVALDQDRHRAMPPGRERGGVGLADLILDTGVIQLLRNDVAKAASV